MAEAKCLNCGKSVKLADKFVGKRIRCPSCGTPILVGGQGDIRLDKDALRQELARLAGTASPEPAGAVVAPESAAPGAEDIENGGQAARPVAVDSSPSAAKPTRKAAESPPAASAPREAAKAPRAAPSPRPADAPKPAARPVKAAAARSAGGPEIQQTKRSYRGVVTAILVVLAMGGVGVGAGYGLRVHQKKSRDRQADLKAAVIADIEAANRSAKPCAEQEALRLCQAALDKARQYERAYADGSFVDRITALQQQVSKLQQLLDARQNTQTQLSQQLEAARKLVEEKKYAEAKKALVDVQAKLKAVTADCEKQQISSISKDVETLLASEPVKYGSLGWTLVQGKWLSPDDLKKMETDKKQAEERRIREEKLKEGLVEYNGAWMKPEEREIRVAREKEDREKKTAEAAAKGAQALAARLQRAKLKELMASNDAVVMLDDLSAGVLWTNEDWANPLKYEVTTSDYYGKKEGEKLLKCTLQEGDKDKWVMSYSLTPDPNAGVDITPRDHIVLDVIVLSGTPEFALGAWTIPWTLFESPPQKARVGITRDLVFSLKNKNFKCLASKWSYNSEITKPEAVYKFSFFVYGKGAEFLVTNVRIIKGDAPKPVFAALPK